MKRALSFWLPLILIGAATVAPGLVARRAAPLTVIAYGDTRFTDPSNTAATNPLARHALIAQMLIEKPDAILISGDLPWRGGVVADYDEFRVETAPWRDAHLRVFPAIGNHEFSQCKPDVCIENWWNAFPELRGKRWYAADLGPGVRNLALDTMSPLVADSPQRVWLEHEIDTLPASIQFVLITLHHPPVADVQTRMLIDHNPRPNEIALRDYLAEATRDSRARFVVLSGHIHNYERFLQDDIAYIVTGGGGAVPYEIDRTPPDLYQTSEFPNFHYVKMTIGDGLLTGQMFRLDEATAPNPHFTLKDTFSIKAR
jgi:hypothetical protein